MPITFRIRPEYNLVIIVHVGTIPDDRFLAFYKSLFESDQYDLSMNLLVDLRQADSASRSSKVLLQFAEFVRTKFSDITARPKVAVVAPDDISFGLASMYEIFAVFVSWDFVVFRAMDAALAWLGLPEDLINGPDQDAQ